MSVLAEVRETALALVGPEVPEEPELEPRLAALVAVGCSSCATAMDLDGIRRHAERALELGASPDEVHEAVVLVSSIGVHALHEGSRVLAEILRERGDPAVTEPLDAEREALVAPIRADRYWQRLEEEIPGFVEALVRFSPEAYRAFVDFCGVPWRTGVLPALEKELIYVGVDSTPTHRYLPGLRLHVRNAVMLGASRGQIVGVLDVAAAAGPAHTVR